MPNSKSSSSPNKSDTPTGKPAHKDKEKSNSGTSDRKSTGGEKKTTGSKSS